MEEIWKDVLKLHSRNSRWEKVKEFVFPKGLYQVSNFGRFKRKGKIINCKPDSVGTVTFSLKCHRFKLHEIVLQTFMPEGDIDGYSPDHINRNNRTNNRVDNLRWADRSTQYNNRNNSNSDCYKKVLCLQNGIVYNSCREAEDCLRLTRNTVSRVARGERKSIHGYNFIFASN
jgi:hypothetical protein